MTPAQRMFPARTGSAAIARRMPATAEHPLDFAITAEPAPDDATTRHREDAK